MGAPVNGDDASSDAGRVLTVEDGFARIHGLKLQVGEMVEFSGGLKGMALKVEKEDAGIAILGHGAISRGDVVKQTHKMMSVPVGDALFGRVIDVSGSPIDGKGPIATNDTRRVNLKAPSILARQPVSEPLLTGIKAIDALVPIGRGQSEVILGDRHTGKTAIAVDIIANQRTQWLSKNKDDKVHCIYVSIGQKRSNVAEVVRTLEEHNAMQFTTVVHAGASDTVTSQFLAPFVGSALAEYFRDSGKHALIIYDDLSKHGSAYRQLSRLFRSAMHQASSADLFYLHSSLLSRAAKMSNKLGGGSLTAIPIIETTAGDPSALVPANVLSMTDGNIFLDTELSHQGIRPAISLGLSLSRPGSAVQSKAMKQVGAQMNLQLSQYREVAAFAQFGSLLDAASRQLLNRGEKLIELLKQEQSVLFAEEEIIACLYAGVYGHLDDISTKDVTRFEAQYLALLGSKHKQILDAISKGGELDDKLMLAMNEVIADTMQNSKLRRLLDERDGNARGLNRDMVLV